MFPNLIEEMRDQSKAIVKVTTLIFTVAAIGIVYLMMQAGDNTYFGIIIGLVIVAIGYSLGRFYGMLVYAFGELLERTCSIEGTLTKDAGKSEPHPHEE